VKSKGGMIVYRTPKRQHPYLQGCSVISAILFSIWWVHSKPGETYSRIPDLYPAGQILMELWTLLFYRFQAFLLEKMECVLAKSI